VGPNQLLMEEFFAPGSVALRTSIPPPPSRWLSSTGMRQLGTDAAPKNSRAYLVSFYVELFSCQAQGVDITRTQITKK
jgi:hypothetical protein